MVLVTLADYLAVRGITCSRVEGKSSVGVHTVTNWCRLPRGFDSRPERRVVQRVAHTMNLDVDVLYQMILNGRKALGESAELRAVRKAVALLEFAREGGVSVDVASVRRSAKYFFPAEALASAERSY
jgi:hypothetical protein